MTFLFPREEKICDALRMAPKGLTATQIATVIECARTTVCDHLRLREQSHGKHLTGPHAHPSLVHRGVVILKKVKAPWHPGQAPHPWHRLPQNAGKTIPVGNRGRPLTLYKLSNWARQDLEADDA